MKTIDHTTALGARSPAASIPQTRLPKAATRLLGLLNRLKIGTLTLYAPDGNSQVFGTHEAPFAALNIHRWEVCAEVLKSATSVLPKATWPATGIRPTWPRCCVC